MGEITPIKNTNIALEIIKEPLYDLNKKKKKEVVKDKEGNVQYLRNDLNGLMSMISKLDTRKHGMQGLKFAMKIKDKLRNAYLEDLDKIDLTVDEGAFLKTFLEGFNEAEGKEQPLQEFEIRTMVGIVEQFGV